MQSSWLTWPVQHGRRLQECVWAKKMKQSPSCNLEVHLFSTGKFLCAAVNVQRATPSKGSSVPSILQGLVGRVLTSGKISISRIDGTRKTMHLCHTRGVKPLQRFSLLMMAFLDRPPFLCAIIVSKHTTTIQTYPKTTAPILRI